MITADSGGSNSSRNRLWKVELQRLADQSGLILEVCHYPPGTSKWNRIEHRNLLATQTEASNTLVAATVTYTYNLDRTIASTEDARSNDFETVWEVCCQRRQATLEPPAAVDDSGTNKRAGRITNYDFYGNITHSAHVKEISNQNTYDYLNPINADTLAEVTTRYDARHRPTHRTEWLVPRDTIDPNNVPIAGENGVPVSEGLTSRFIYDDDLTDGQGLDASFPTLFAGLDLGTGSDGSAVLSTNPEGERTLSVSDGGRRIIREAQLDANGVPLNQVTTSYDSIVNVIGFGDVVEVTTTDALGHASTTRGDGQGRVIEAVDAGDATANPPLARQLTSRTYDSVGNVLSIRDPNGIGMDCIYDDRGREISCTDTFGDTLSTSFDLHNNVVSAVDSKNQVESAVYDARDRLMQLTDRLNGVQGFTYDENSNLLTVTDADASGTVPPFTEYVYDARNLRVELRYPDHDNTQTFGAASYDKRLIAYDALRRPRVVTDQQGQTIRLLYDLVGRRTAREYRATGVPLSNPPTDTDSFVFDRASRVISATKGRYSNTVSLSYDDAGRPVEESLSIGGQTYTIGFGFDTANRMINLVYPDGTSSTRSYTDRNQLQEINYQGSQVASFVRDAGGRRTIKNHGNGLTTTVAYRSNGVDKDNRVASISNAVVGDYTYAYDANKNRVSESITGSLSGYGYSTGPGGGYDAKDRLISWDRDDLGRSLDWTLSLEGDWQNYVVNGSSETRTHDSVHQIILKGGSGFTYDARGNVTQSPVRGGQTYQWDIDGALSEVSTTAGINTYEYDAFGRRVRVQRTAGGTSDFVYVHAGDQVMLMQEYGHFGGPGGNVWLKYVYSSYVDEPLIMIHGNSITSGAEQKYYYHQNSLHSVVAISDQAGQIVERYAYDPYGNTTILDPVGLSLRSLSAVENAYFFTGRRQELTPGDLVTGLHFYRARYFDPELGRFLSRDPTGYADGLNLYEYVRSQPLDRTDPSGLKSCGEECGRSKRQHSRIWYLKNRSRILKCVKRCQERRLRQLREDNCGTCGLEIGQRLDNALQAFNAKFYALSLSEKASLCANPLESIKWDIGELFTAGHAGQHGGFRSQSCGEPPCEGSVTVYGRCHWAAEVNYVLWGRWTALCGHDKADAMPLLLGWRSINHGIWQGRFISDDYFPDSRSHGAGIWGRLRWTLAGYENNENERLSIKEYSKEKGLSIDQRIVLSSLPYSGEPLMERECTPCNEKYRGVLTVSVGVIGANITVNSK